MKTTRRALALSFTSQYITLAVQFVATVIIARLLDPAEIGIFSIGAAVVTLAHLLRDFGSGNYIIQEKELTNDRIRAAFTVTLIIGWSLAVLISISSTLAGDFYQDPGIGRVLSLLAVTFFLLPFGSVTMAYFQRQMDFRPVTISRISSAVVSASTSVGCAYQGFSYMSLAWGSIAGSLTTLLVAIYFRPKTLPLLPGFKEIPRVLRFGGHMTTVSVLGEITQVAPELILGRIQGMAAVGLFSRAQGVVNIFHRLVLSGLSPVVTPFLAEKHRNHKELTAPYLLGLSYMTGLSWPFFAAMTVVADDFVVALYGEKWLAAGDIIQLWSLAMIINFLSYLSNPLLVATGNIQILTRLNLLIAPTQIMLVALAAQYTLAHVAGTFIATGLMRITLLWPHYRRILGIDLKQYFGALGKSAWITASTLATVSITLNACTMISVDEPLQVVLACTAVVAPSWLAMVRWTGHPLWKEVQMLAGKLRLIRNG